jgi:senataxin
VISPYKSQVRQLKDRIFKLLRCFCDVSLPQDFIEINTVDAFQGREKDIIIFSCVRSSKERQLGFLSDYRRMNVAITRARHCLYVVGNQNTLTRDANWKGFIQFC